MSIDTSKHNYGFARVGASQPEIAILGVALFYNDKTDATTLILALEDGSFVMAGYNGRVTRDEIFESSVEPQNSQCFTQETMAFVLMAAGAMSKKLQDLGFSAHGLGETISVELWESAVKDGRLHTQVITGKEVGQEEQEESNSPRSETIVSDSADGDDESAKPDIELHRATPEERESWPGKSDTDPLF